MTSAAASTPDWDMTPYYDAPGSDAYTGFREALARDTAALLEEVAGLAAITRESASAWASLFSRLEDVTSRSNHLAGYLACMGAADSRDEWVKRETASAAAARADQQKVFVAARAALRQVDDEAFDVLLAIPEVFGAEHFLRRLRESATFTMEPDLEGLVAELDVDGLAAWGRLYNQTSGTLEFDLVVPGRETRTLPVAMSRSVLEDPDPAVRRGALSGSNAAWESRAEVFAACLNAIAGTRLTLYRRRGVEHFLDPALFDAGISRPTLDALLEAVRSRQDVPRRYLRRKAELLGVDALGWQDLMAPLPLSSDARIPWDAARERVLSSFRAFYPALGAFAGEAFERRWIDHTPRSGKRPGGFCSTSPLIGESRIFLTFNETVGDLFTLAHELGHAFHSRVMKEMRPWSRRYPMTLAETASTFAEQVVIESALSDPQTTPEDRAATLHSRMQDGAVFLLDIPTRFDFEAAFYEERARGEVGIARLCELMEEAQQRNFGDVLAADQRNPWFWASKLHFYITGISFYNFPYTFGYLFSMGIFARALEEGPDFLARYEELLRLTGSDTAEEVARRALGVDLTKADFWSASIDLLARDFDRFEDACRGVVPGA
jgi:oligoendopeptidase F